MRKYLFCLFALIAVFIAGCGEKNGGGILDEISGVWVVQGEQGLFSIIYRDKRLSLLHDDAAIPVTLGEIDNENKTVNLNVTLQSGKPGIWTLRQIWDKDHKSFHLQFTFHDGTRSDLTFVRKISTDDLNKIAYAEARNQPNAMNAATLAKPAEAPLATKPAEQSTLASVPVAESAPVPQAVGPVAVQPQVPAQITWAPSFDCAKASVGAEKLICSNQELSALDVEMAEVYKLLLNIHPDKDSLRKEQIEWRKKERDVCSTVDCMVQIYRSRNNELEVTFQKVASKLAR